jgi:hypothetical protein
MAPSMRVLRLVLLGLAPALLACHAILPLDQHADGCNEDQALPPLVAACDPACTVGEDCDGLPDYRDFHKNYCSNLIYEQTFGTNPDPGWELDPSSGTDWVWQCGRLQQLGVDNTDKWALARESEAALQANGLDYLVEARLQLGAPGDTRDPRWGVGIGARAAVSYTDRDYAVCELWVDPNALRRPAVDPDVRVDAQNGGKSSYGALENAPTPGVEGKSGETYILQMWVTRDVKQFNPNTQCSHTPCPGVMCILYNDQRPLRGGYFNLTWGSQYVPTTTGVVGFRTVNRAASFDYLRVFALSNP